MTVVPNRPYFPGEDRREIAEKVEEILATGELTSGKYVKHFEGAFAEKVGCRHAVATSSGTAALEIIFRVLEVEKRDVIVPTNTFIATPNAVRYAGGTPVFADIDKGTLCMDASSLCYAHDRHGPAAKAAVLVHIGGTITPQIELIEEKCEERGLWLVEDAAHAHGSEYKNTHAGRFGIAGAFSFYATKTMTTAEGGMIVTDENWVAEEAGLLRDQGKMGSKPDVICRFGNAWRMSELHALLGIYQLSRLEEFIAAREKVAGIYDDFFHDLFTKDRRLISQDRTRQMRHSLYKYVVFLNDLDRATFKKTLQEKTGLRLPGEVYAIPCHNQPVYRFRWGLPYTLSIADAACASHICLPIHAAMSEADAHHVTECLRRL